MAEDQDRPGNKIAKAPWLKIFTAFKVALDPKKLLLAAVGILLTSVGWWFLSLVFYSMGSRPMPEDYITAPDDPVAVERSFKAFAVARQRWDFIHKLAGDRRVAVDEADVATSYDQYKELTDPKMLPETRARLVAELRRQRGLGEFKPYGEFRSLPWSENRGPNQYLVVANLIKHEGSNTVDAATNLGRAGFLVLFEPLVKFLKPIVYFFDEGASGFRNVTYLILVILWTVLVWGVIGGAITRLAVVQVARNEKVGFGEAVGFARTRLQSYFSAPVLPLIFLAGLTVVLWVVGLAALIPFLGELLTGLFWPVVLLVTLLMAVVMVGLTGWPLMNATISTEGSDSFDALSRSYSYVYQAPWHYIWYSFLALLYGAVLIFFIGFMGSLIVYLGKWGVTNNALATSYFPSRDPGYLFVNAPTSFGWRNLLLQDYPAATRDATGNLTVTEEHYNSLEWYKKMGIHLVTFWLGLVFLLVVGFGYSYFWTAMTIVYLLMRHKVDDTDLDEVHLEEDDADLPFMPEKPAPPAPSTPTTASGAPPGVTFTMVDAPQMKPSTPPPSPQVPVVDPTPPGPESPPDGR